METYNNITPAARLATVGEYYLQRKMKEVARLNAEGKDIVSLGIGGPDCPPAQEVIDTMVENVKRPDTHSYQLGIGLPELREAFSAWYKKHYNVDLNPTSEILPLIGSKEGILHISMAFINPGDRVLVPNPGYPTYTSVSRLVGAEIVNYDLSEDLGWMPDFNALEKMDLTGVKLMWTNFPNMPTGAPAWPGLFNRLIDFGRRHNIVIVHDNPYSFILNENPMSILSVEGAKDIAIEMNSLSKSHNMAGWRVGMLASNPTFVQWILKVKSNIDSGQFKPLMLAAARALAIDDSWYEELNKTYRQRRVVIEQIMTALGCKFDPRQQGLFLWGRIPDDCPSSEYLADKVLNEARVFITPGFIFGSNGERYIRLSLCAPVDKLNEALKRVTEFNSK